MDTHTSHAEPAPPLPQFVRIEPVGQCNLRCRMCPVQYRPDGRGGPPAFMPFDRFCALLEQFPGRAELHLQGLGEPLLHPRFFDMVRVAASRGIKVSTNTNLTVLTAGQAQQCIDSGSAAMVWAGAAYAQFRARLSSAEPPDICAGCAIYRGTF
jgi:MoaA/NifB/PqqE/SkfB family radical SAM enzyme